MKQYCIFFLLFFFAPALFAQDESVFSHDTKPRNKEYYGFSARAGLTVPHPTGNRAFRKSFTGVYEINAGFNVILFKGVFAGVVYETGFLKVMENKIPDYNAGMTTNNAGIKVGGDSYIGEKNRLIFSASVTAGQNSTRFSSLVCKDTAHPAMITGYKTTFVKPEIGMYLLAESNLGIGIILSYTIYSHDFNPHDICLDDWAEYAANNPGATQHFNFGFGFYYSFLRKKK